MTERSSLPSLPEAVASFGAAVCGDHVYVYGGHVGRAHQHSRDNLARGFHRLQVDRGESWESLPPGPPLQGLALVSHGDAVYRIGGMSARNAAGEEADLESTPSVARFRDETGWVEMTPLPEGRSSHDAAVLGDTVYVVGGWTLAGKDGESTWLGTAYRADLTRDRLEWEPLPEPPFRRRALAVAAAGPAVCVIGGIQDEGGTSARVDLYDVGLRTWSRGPDFPVGEGMKAFGVSAFGVDGAIHASAGDGEVFRLVPGEESWEKTGARLARPRFFHRLVARGADLLFLGGSGDGGHLADVETVRRSGAGRAL